MAIENPTAMRLLHIALIIEDDGVGDVSALPPATLR